MDAVVLRHDCLKMLGDWSCVYTVSGKDVAHSLWFLAIYDLSGFAGEVVSNESAVVENASFLCRSL